MPTGEGCMRPQCYVIALAVIFSSSLAATKPVETQRYVICETGTSVDIPATIFSNDAGRPEIGDGRRFLSSDGRANLTVQYVPNQAGASPAVFLAKKKPPAGIEYKRVTP